MEEMFPENTTAIVGIVNWIRNLSDIILTSQPSEIVRRSRVECFFSFPLSETPSCVLPIFETTDNFLHQLGRKILVELGSMWTKKLDHFPFLL